MQLGGIGDNHSADMHQVTSCLHDHGKQMEGKLGMKAELRSAYRQTIQENQEQQAQLSLTDILQKLLRSSRQRLLGFWNGSGADVTGDKAGKSDKSQVMAPISDINVAKETDTAAKEAVLQSNPYFAAVAEPPKPTGVPLLKKVKLKCKDVAGQLAQHLPGRFFNFQKKGSFQAKKEGSREDLRKRSKYRQDKVEIDCVLTDESYLLDSYDRKGEYSQLTTKK
ncbi:MAG: hypothetical protein J1E03_06695 [Acetatifactor sp.]|nr:hypothetical protein [Acetatifactor sp.]